MSHRKFAIAAAALFSLISAVTAQQQPTSQNPPTDSAPATPVVLLPIAIGDELEVSVFGVPEMEAHERVDGAGNINLALIKSVHVAGLTNDAAEALIEKRLRDGGFLKDPHVSIFVKEYSSSGIAVLGEVQHPGVYPANGTRHLWDMILAAGGATERAGTGVLIRHRDSGQTEQLTLSNNPGEAIKSNVEVAPGDSIVVERAGVVYVLGEVKHAAGYVMPGDSMTVLQALAKAEGPTDNAALNRASLLRKQASSTQQISVDLKQILNAKSQDVAMQDGDILFIPGRRGRYAAHNTMQTILAIATGVAIRGY
jgi:polysaccharide export outer membrane protein